VNARRFLFYASWIDDHDAWDCRKFEKCLQEGSDLGERIAKAFTRTFQDVGMAVIIGSDCIELTTTIIEQAFTMLETHDAVIGTARDGGYYLLGIKQFYPALFNGKEWSTPSVLQDTIADFNRLKITHAFTPTLSDIDDLEDLMHSSRGGPHVPSVLQKDVITTIHHINMKT
jgi:rSAM/selenodomain-associated transferase 1